MANDKGLDIPEIPERLKRVSDLADSVDRISEIGKEPDTMFKYRLRAPYSDSPKPTSSMWQTE